MDNDPISTHPIAQFGEAILTEARRVEEDALHSSKGHFEAASAWDHRHFWIGIPTTIIAAAAGVTALSHLPIVSGILAFLAAATSGLVTFLNPKQRAAAHFKAGNAYKALHNDARIFREIDCQQGLTPQALSARIHALNATRNTLNAESPQIPRRAFENARKGIEAGEASYQVDKR
jgi:hypothetical protein